jgi:hypothetical protein
MALLQQHLQRVLEGEYSTLDSRSTAAELTIDLPAASLHNSSPAGSSGNRGSASIAAINSRTRSITLAGISASEDSSKDTATEHPAPEGAFNASMFQTEPAVAVLWRTVRKNQYSFGHGECVFERGMPCPLRCCAEWLPNVLAKLSQWSWRQWCLALHSHI